MGNEHNTSGLLQKNVYINKINQKLRQQVRNEQVENKKTMTKNKTMQTQTNVGNEHDRNNNFVFFVSKDSMCNFSTFDTTCVNRQKKYKNQYPPTNIKKSQ
jgi:hypothetical protein